MDRDERPCFEVKAECKGHLTSCDSRAAQPDPSGLRWESGGNPNTQKFAKYGYLRERCSGASGKAKSVETEDDLLHIKELPTFDERIGAADAEMLLSYLTVPYLRLPLTLEFFATQSRLQALASEDARRLLWGVLFEPGACVPSQYAELAPKGVPAVGEEKMLLGTPYGLLLNECTQAPKLAPRYTLDLLRQALRLRTHTYHCKTTELILYIVRLALHVQSAVSFLLLLATGEHESLRLEQLPGLRMSQLARRELAAFMSEAVGLIRKQVR